MCDASAPRVRIERPPPTQTNSPSTRERVIYDGHLLADSKTGLVINQ